MAGSPLGSAQRRLPGPHGTPRRRRPGHAAGLAATSLALTTGLLLAAACSPARTPGGGGSAARATAASSGAGRSSGSSASTAPSGGGTAGASPAAGPSGGAPADCDSLATCYTPQQLQVAYGIRPLLDRGIDGRGETIVFPELAESRLDPPDVTDLR